MEKLWVFVLHPAVGHADLAAGAPWLFLLVQCQSRKKLSLADRTFL